MTEVTIKKEDYKINWIKSNKQKSKWNEYPKNCLQFKYDLGILLFARLVSDHVRLSYLSLKTQFEATFLKIFLDWNKKHTSSQSQKKQWLETRLTYLGKRVSSLPRQDVLIAINGYINLLAFPLLSTVNIIS